MLLSIIAATLAGSLSAGSLAQGITSYQQKEKSNEKMNISELRPPLNEELALSKRLAISIEDLQNSFGINHDEIKNAIENSISKGKNGRLKFDLLKLTLFEGTAFYGLIYNNEFWMSNILDMMLENKLLQFDSENGNFSFSNFEETSVFNGHIWFKWYWYWFLYWEAYFDHFLSDWISYLGGIGAGIADFVEIIGNISGPFAIGAAAFAAACSALSFYFSYYDHGRGVCFIWDGFIPREVRPL